MRQDFALPFPPTVNTYWRHVVIGKQARVLLSEEGRNYRKAVARFVLQQRIQGVGNAALDVALRVNPPDRRRRDLDNLPKGILDGLKHAGVYDDDSQVQRLTIVRCGVCEFGSIDVTLVSYPEAQSQLNFAEGIA
jgi:crossover junction endodeoxyribonuclease RusA